MLRKLLIISAALAASITASNIRITAQQSGAPPNANQPGNSSNEQQRETGNEQGQRNSIPPPPISIVNNVNSGDQPAARQQEADNGYSWWRTSAPAEWAVVVVGGLTAWAAFTTLRRIKDEIQISSRAATAAEKAATATKEAADAARESIVLTHRPKMVIREIDIPESDALFRMGSSDDFEKALETSIGAVNQFTGTFRVINQGNTAATCHFVSGAIFVGPSLPKPTNNPAIGKGIANLGTVKTGYVTDVTIPARPVTADEVRAIRHREQFLFVVGKIVYTDDLKNGRRTGFARRFNVQTGRFEVIDDPDYEYLD